jgi:hypothetical protein
VSALQANSKLAGEAKIALDDIVHIGDAMADHESSFKSHAESESTVNIGINSACCKNSWIYHSATTPLDPTIIEENIYFSTWLGEWKE